jgi:hypothetical protein
MTQVRLFATILVLIVATTTAASAGTLWAYAAVESSITFHTSEFDQPSPPWYFMDAGSNNTTPVSVPFSATEQLYGSWLNHGVEDHGWLGSYSVNLRADARANYGDVGIYLLNETDGGTWLGCCAMSADTRAFAEASFSDTFHVPAPDADYVRFIFDLHGSSRINGGEPPYPSVEVNHSIEYPGPDTPAVVQLPVGPGGEVDLNVRLFMELVCTGPGFCGMSVEADFYNSLRLIGTEVVCSDCSDGLTSDQRLFSKNQYPGVDSIVTVPEPSSFWLFALALALLAIRRI